MRNAMIFICSCLLAVACSPDKSSVINGTAPDEYNGSWVYMADYAKNTPLDSALVENGKFSFAGTPDTNNYIRLDLDRKLFANVIPERGTIEVDLSNPAKVSGTPLNDQLAKYITEIDGFYKENNDAWGELMDTFKDDEQTLLEKSEEFKNQRLLLFDVLNDDYFQANKTNALGVYVFVNWYYELDAEKIDALYAEMGDNIKTNATIQQIIQANEQKKQTSEGQPFTNFTVEHGNTDLSSASLSDYVGKGKYVLVDFWASWCGPCLAETPVIAEVYRKYRGDRFEVLGVAVWDEREATLTAIEAHHIVWPQIIDAQQVPTELYGINGIPHIILFGPDGTILARGLRGDALKAKVAEVLN